MSAPSFRLFVMVNSRFTDNGDARIHYLDSGDDDRGAPIVFVPGMTDIADDYVEVMPVFGRQDTRRRAQRSRKERRSVER